MSIDEAIEKESKIAKENQKIVDTQIVFDNVSISELYCDDTEVIEEHLSNYKKCAEYHEQLAEWLEELKRRREYDGEIIGSGTLNNAYNQGYNRALDDIVIIIKERVGMDWDWDFDFIEEIAEQLKAGGK